MAPAVLAPREGVGVLLQDPDPIPPVLHSTLVFSVVWNQYLHLLNSFIIALIILVYIIYVNHLRYHILFDLHLCVNFFLTLLHVHLPPPLLLCPPSPTYLTFQTLFLLPPPSSCTCCHTQRLISSPAPPTHPHPPISFLPGYCPESSSMMSHLYFFSKTTSSPSLTFPSLNYSSINY